MPYTHSKVWAAAAQSLKFQAWNAGSTFESVSLLTQVLTDLNVSNNYWNSLKVFRTINSGIKQEQNCPSVFNSLLLLWLMALAMFCIFHLFITEFCDVWDFRQGFNAILGCWEFPLTALNKCSFWSDLWSHGCNASQEKTNWYQNLKLVGKIFFHYHITYCSC